MTGKSTKVAENLTSAINFAKDWQRFTDTAKFKKLIIKHGYEKATGLGILEMLDKGYPKAEVSKHIKFEDGSRAILTTQGFKIE